VRIWRPPLQAVCCCSTPWRQIALLQVQRGSLRASGPSLAVCPVSLKRNQPGLDALVPEPKRSQGLHAGLAETSPDPAPAPERCRSERPVDIGQLSMLGSWGWSRRWKPPPPGWSPGGACTQRPLAAAISPPPGLIGDAAAPMPSWVKPSFTRLCNGWRQLRRASSAAAAAGGLETVSSHDGYSCDLH